MTTNEKMQKMAYIDIMKFGTTTITAAANALTIDLVAERRKSFLIPIFQPVSSTLNINFGSMRGSNSAI